MFRAISDRKVLAKQLQALCRCDHKLITLGNRHWK